MNNQRDVARGNWSDSTARLLLQMNKAGIGIGTMMRRMGYKKVAIYGAGVIGRILYQELIDSDVDVPFFIDNNLTLASPPKGVTAIYPEELGKEKVDAIIATHFTAATVPPFSFLHYLRRKMPGCHIAHITEFLLTSHEYGLFADTVNHVRDSGAFLWMADYYGGATQHAPEEIALMRYVITIDEVVYCPDSVKEFYKDIPYLSDEYIMEIFTAPPSTQRNGTVFIEDVCGKYLNFIDGSRLNPYISNDNEARLLVFGPCHVAGLGVEDKHTLASQMQLYFQTHLPNRYNVYSYGYLSWEPLFNRICNFSLNAGDVVLIFTPFLKRFLYAKDKGEFHIEFDDIQEKLLTMRDQRGLTIDSSHFSPKGYAVIANMLSEKLIEMDSQGKLPRVKPATPEIKNPSEMSKTTEISKYFPRKEAEQLMKYLDYLRNEKEEATGNIGAIVMNCNPFTNGHRYLVEQASLQTGYLYILVVEEDKSAFPFTDRYRLVQEGLKDLNNVKVLKGGRYIISAMTLPEYFEKESGGAIQVNASLDLEIFAKFIAPTLGVNIRFAGTEPLCRVTNQYNQAMADTLPKYGIEFRMLDRHETDGSPISASRVRELLKKKNYDEIQRIVPESTYIYLLGLKH